MKEHKLKCWSSVLADIKTGLKSWEYRQNDRDYSVGDQLLLYDWNPNTNKFISGRPSVIAEVTYVIHGGRFGIPEGYCVMSIKLLKVEK